jgi:hypothetical protein
MGRTWDRFTQVMVRDDCIRHCEAVVCAEAISWDRFTQAMVRDETVT